jgi:tRNA nucleotidyltransferase/poly(A) polymerase
MLQSSVAGSKVILTFRCGGWSVHIQDRVLSWLADQQVAVYLVGGCVRDRLLNRPIYDLDAVTAGDGLALARKLADDLRGAYYPLDESRGTGRAILHAQSEQALIVDIARFRGDNLAADLADRDFTINALAADVRSPDHVIDQHHGLADLKARLIRPVSDASIHNDPVRALRAVRLAAQLRFALAPETEALIRRDGQALDSVAGERIRDELARLLALPEAAPSLVSLDSLGLLAAILPELEPERHMAQSPPHYLDVLTHSLQTVQTLEALLAQLAGADPTFASNSQLDLMAPFARQITVHLAQETSETRPRLVTLKMAALLHDTGKPLARTRDGEGRIRFIGHEQYSAQCTAQALRRLRFNRTEIRLGETIVRHHMRPLLLAAQGGVSSRAIYRLFRDTGDAGVDVLLHALADHRAAYAPTTEDDLWPRLLALTAQMLADYWDHHEERVAPTPLIDGHDLLREFKLEPGPRIGELLEAVREAQVTGQIQTREQALALVQELLSS